MLVCPKCKAKVAVKLPAVDGTTTNGGHRSVVGGYLAACAECGTEFTQEQIDADSWWE